MGEFLHSMAYPFMACLVLTGIHVYLGIHVIERKVIFVDLALATIAALGAVWGALLGWDIHDDVWQIKGFSLGFTVLGAGIFSLTRMRHERVPHEAFIGITYAVALAAIILGSAKLPHGAEEVRALQAGSILWVEGRTIALTALVYGAVGIFHFAFRKRFLLLSTRPEEAAARGVNVRFWDFLFYVSFGVVVTSSVSIAGVLLVFSYLVIPSVVAVLFAESIAARLAIGWTVGTLVSASGVSVSYYADLPSGPVIVVAFGLFLLAAGIVDFLRRSPHPGRSLMHLAGGGALLSSLVGSSVLLRKTADPGVVHLLETGTKAEKVMALAQLHEEPDLWDEAKPRLEELLERDSVEVRLAILDLVASQRRVDAVDTVVALLRDEDDIVREQAVRCLRTLDVPETADALLEAAEDEPDDYLKVEMAEAVLEMGDSRGVPILLDVMDRGEVLQARQDAFEHLKAHVDTDLEYHARADPGTHSREIEAFRRWWSEAKGRVFIHPASEPPGD